MPTKPSKGDHGHADAGSKGRGNQKATYGSAVSEDVAEGRREVGADVVPRDEERTED
jgi:hypothetical protein